MSVALVVLVVAGVWAIIEIALLMHASRKAVKQASESIAQSGAKIEQVASQAVPLLEHADEAVQQAGSSIGDVRPLLDRVGTAVGTLNTDLEHVSNILGDASRITGAASNATTAVGGATSAVADKFRGLFGKKKTDDDSHALEEPHSSDEHASASGKTVQVDRPKVITSDTGYFTYPQTDSTDELPTNTTGAQSAMQTEPKDEKQTDEKSDAQASAQPDAQAGAQASDQPADQTAR